MTKVRSVAQSCRLCGKRDMMACDSLKGVRAETSQASPWTFHPAVSLMYGWSHAMTAKVKFSVVSSCYIQKKKYGQN